MANFQRTVSNVSFPDVPADAWYADDVRTAVELGIMNGKSDGSFDPLGSLTLAEAVTMAAKTRSIYEGGGFIPGGAPWYQNAVDYAEEMGIILDGEYMDYTQPATKADMAGAPNMEYEQEPRFDCFRGLFGYYLEMRMDTTDQRRNHYQVWCLENSIGYYVVVQTFYGDTPDELWEQSRDLLYSLDLAL